MDLGQLLRLKGRVDAAATVTEPDGSAAPALTESYMRLREQILKMLDGGDLSAEFNESFPEIEIVGSPGRHPRDVALAQMAHTVDARRAQTLLAQLAGWLDGLIQAETYEQRMRIEAEEKAKRQAPGFTS
jgi:hypothetical protein